MRLQKKHLLPLLALSSTIFASGEEEAYHKYIELPSHKQHLVFKHYKSYLESPEASAEIKPDYDLYLGYLNYLNTVTRKNLSSTTRGQDRFERKVTAQAEESISFDDYPMEALACEDESNLASSFEDSSLYLQPVGNKLEHVESAVYEKDLDDRWDLFATDDQDALWHDNWSLWDNDTDHDNLFSLEDNIDSHVKPPAEAVSIPEPTPKPSPVSKEVKEETPQAKEEKVPSPTPSTPPSPTVKDPEPQTPEALEPISPQSSPQTPTQTNEAQETSSEGWGSWFVRKVKEFFGYTEDEAIEDQSESEDLSEEATSEEEAIDNDNELDSLDEELEKSLNSQTLHFLGTEFVEKHLSLQYAQQIAAEIAKNDGGNEAEIYAKIKKAIEDAQNKRK